MHSCYQFYFVSLWLVTEVICILKCVAPPTFLIIKMSISVFFLFLHTRTQIRYSNGSFSGSYYLFLSKQLCVPTWDQVHDVSITLDFVSSRRWGGNESGEIIPCFVLGKESHTGKWYITHLVATYNRCLRNCKMQTFRSLLHLPQWLLFTRKRDSMGSERTPTQLNWFKQGCLYLVSWFVLREVYKQQCGCTVFTVVHQSLVILGKCMILWEWA